MGKLIFIPAVLLLLGGCSAGPEGRSADAADAGKPALSPTPSGFLHSYGNLKPSPYHRGTLYEQSPKLASYTKFMIEPVVVLTQRMNLGRPGEAIDSATSAKLAELARDEVINSLRVNNQIVEQGGPGVARIKSAITGVGGLAAEGGMPSRFNAASVEMEIVDSVSGERLAAAMEADQVNLDDLYDSGASEAMSGRYDLVRLVFTHWSSRMNLFLERARRGE